MFQARRANYLRHQGGQLKRKILGYREHAVLDLLVDLETD